MFKTILSLCAVLLVPSLAMATGGVAGGFDASTVSVDTSAFMSIAGTIAAALGTLWGVYKAIQLIRGR